MTEEFPQMAFNLLKKVTVWLVNGEESPVEGEGKERYVQCFDNKSIWKNSEDIKMTNIKFQVFNYMSYYIQNDLLSKHFRFATVSRFSVKDLK